jgi:hypothetical protein
MMRLFSSRRQSITADLRGRAARFEQRYGRAPSQCELAQLGQASNFATRKGKDGALDFDRLHADWAGRLARSASRWHLSPRRHGTLAAAARRKTRVGNWTL